VFIIDAMVQKRINAAQAHAALVSIYTLIEGVIDKRSYKVAGALARHSRRGYLFLRCRCLCGAGKCTPSSGKVIFSSSTS
jgi:hypothetical protein